MGWTLAEEQAAETARLAAADAAIIEAAARVGLITTAQTCHHQPRREHCAPCTEVALRLALAEVEEVHAEYD